MAPSEVAAAKIARRAAEYRPTYQRFVLKQKNYSQQYSHIYVNRLVLLRDAVLRQVEEQQEKTPERRVPVLPKIIDLRPGAECVIIGTTLKVLDAKPDLFEALTSDDKIISLTAMARKLATANDQLILEDESGRVELTGDINIGEIVTGVVLGVRGRMLEGKGGCFHVDGVYVPSPAPQRPLPERAESEYVALVSGLGIGRNRDPVPLRNHLVMDYLAGRLGDDEEKGFVSRIVRTIVVGNSVDGDSATGPVQTTGIAKRKSTEQLALEAAPMRNLDELLSTLACAMSVDVMPGDSDPSNHALPQQSFHSCLFPRSARFASFRAVTNPYEAEIGGVAFLGHSGQPLQSLLQCTIMDDDALMRDDAADQIDNDTKADDMDDPELALDCLQRCLEWRHAAPTAPDLLPSFPMASDDPFIVESGPHIFFAGNTRAFGSRVVDGPKGQRTRIVLVPSFAETSTIVLVDLKDLSCFPITLEL